MSKSGCYVPEEELCVGRVSENVSVVFFWNYLHLSHFNYSKFWELSEHGEESLFCYFGTFCTYTLIPISSKFFLDFFSNN